MNKLNEDIKELIDTIESIERSILSGKGEEPEKLFPKMMEMIGLVFPEIVQEEQNADYWMELLKRISTALETDDRFLMVDILHYEVKKSLLQYQQWRTVHG